MRTPKRIRCSRGRGTNAASRCMNSRGDIIRCVVPSRQGVLSLSTTCPAALVCTRSLASAGRVMVRHCCQTAATGRVRATRCQFGSIWQLHATERGQVASVLDVSPTRTAMIQRSGDQAGSGQTLWCTARSYL